MPDSTYEIPLKTGSERFHASYNEDSSNHDDHGSMGGLDVLYKETVRRSSRSSEDMMAKPQSRRKRARQLMLKHIPGYGSSSFRSSQKKLFDRSGSNEGRQNAQSDQYASTQSHSQTPNMEQHPQHTNANSNHGMRTQQDLMYTPMTNFSTYSVDDVFAQDYPVAPTAPDVQVQFAQQETKSIARYRRIIFLILILVAVGTCVGIYLYISNMEQEQLDSIYEDEVEQFCAVVRQKYANHVSTLKGFGYNQLFLSAGANDTASSFWTVPDVERRGGIITDIGEFLSVLLLSPLADRQEFERYATDNQGWLLQSLELQRDRILQLERQQQQQFEWMTTAVTKDDAPDVTSALPPLSIDAIPSTIRSARRLSNGTIRYEPESSTELLPIWQMVPALNEPDLILTNLLSDEYYGPLLKDVLEWQEQTSSDNDDSSIIIDSFLGSATTRWGAQQDSSSSTTSSSILPHLMDRMEQKWYELTRTPFQPPKPNQAHSPNLTDPNAPSDWYLYSNVVSNILVPIVDDVNGVTRAVFSAMFSWDAIMENDLREHARLTVVLNERCGIGTTSRSSAQFTYEIVGERAIYRGARDLHDTQYNSDRRDCLLVTAAPYTTACRITMSMYPNDDLRDEYTSNADASYTIVVAIVFCIIVCIVCCFDRLVEKRQRVVFESAMSSSAIVSSLFPDNVRERLYDDNAMINNAPAANANKMSSGMSVSGSTTSKLRTTKGFNKHLNDPTNSMDSYLSILKEEVQKQDAPSVMQNSVAPPIADLFDECTVLFADIVGFATWSSGREAADIFILLETIYNAFDKIANKRKVFKVETIGDCYLAVTGLPEPQKDHAVILALFAHECLRKMKALIVRELRNQLGSNTSTLSMRFGLHSGPVTAGVLRGEKSRFQLFGDTVNTAARMETTGKRSKIHVSTSTADILVAAGKKHWLEERKDMVEAKGKGKLKTFWLRPRAYNAERDGENANVETDGDTKPNQADGNIQLSTHSNQSGVSNNDNKRTVDLEKEPIDVNSSNNNGNNNNNNGGGASGGNGRATGAVPPRPTSGILRSTSVQEEEGLVGTSFGATPMDDVSDIDEEEASLESHDEARMGQPPPSDLRDDEFITTLKPLDVSPKPSRPPRRPYPRRGSNAQESNAGQSAFSNSSASGMDYPISPLTVPSTMSQKKSAMRQSSPTTKKAPKKSDEDEANLYTVHVKQTAQTRREMAGAFRSARLGGR